MPLYEYEHTGKPCKKGKTFEVTQDFEDDALEKCPHCGRKVVRLISGASIQFTKGPAELKNMGFTKLVRRDKGVYENVTAQDGESKVWEQDKPETMPDFKSRFTDGD
jgi:putative FmdB family regulatory protein